MIEGAPLAHLKPLLVLVPDLGGQLVVDVVALVVFGVDDEDDDVAGAAAAVAVVVVVDAAAAGALMMMLLRLLLLRLLSLLLLLLWVLWLCCRKPTPVPGGLRHNNMYIFELPIAMPKIPPVLLVRSLHGHTSASARVRAFRPTRVGTVCWRSVSRGSSAFRAGRVF